MLLLAPVMAADTQVIFASHLKILILNEEKNGEVINLPPSPLFFALQWCYRIHLFFQFWFLFSCRRPCYCTFGQHCLNQINQFPDQLPCSLNQTVRGKALKYNLIGARALLELNPRFIQPIDLVCKNQQ